MLVTLCALIRLPICLLICLPICATALLACAVLLYAIHGKTAQVFGRSAWRGPGTRRSVALTFDDGPSDSTLDLAEMLRAESVRATFFVCGANVERLPGVTGELSRRGHEIANHTYSHRRLCPRLGWQPNYLRTEQVFEEMARAQEVIIADAGVTPRLFRAPYGMRWFGVGEAQRRLGLLGVLWTAIGEDWHWDEDRVVKHLLRRVRPGAILCLHDGRDTRPRPDVTVTLRAVGRLVPELKAMGYRFETVSELLRSDAEAGSTVDDTSP